MDHFGAAPSEWFRGKLMRNWVVREFSPSHQPGANACTDGDNSGGASVVHRAPNADSLLVTSVSAGIAVGAQINHSGAFPGVTSDPGWTAASACLFECAWLGCPIGQSVRLSGSANRRGDRKVSDPAPPIDHSVRSGEGSLAQPRQAAGAEGGSATRCDSCRGL
jgi:hypothetical protein